MKLDQLTSQELLIHIVRYHLPKEVSRAKPILSKYFNNINIKPIGNMSEFAIAKLDKVAWNTEIAVSNAKGSANIVTYLIWDK